MLSVAFQDTESSSNFIQKLSNFITLLFPIRINNEGFWCPNLFVE